MKRLSILLSIIFIIALFAGCNADPREAGFKEAAKQAEEMNKLSLKEKFDKLGKDTKMLESRAILGAPTYDIQDKLGDQNVTVYIWKDKDGTEVGAAFLGASLLEKLDKDQIEFFKNNSKESK